MYDWQKLEGAILYPHRCIFCVEQKDVVDSELDLELGQARWGRVYICKNHGRAIARAFGFSKGKEQDRIANAAATVGAIEKERDDYKARCETVEDERAEAMARVEMLESERDLLQGRVSQLTERIVGEGRALLELAKRN